MNLPPQLLKAVEEDRCVFFFGAGVSQNAGLPSARNLADLLENELREDIKKDSKLAGKLDDLDRSSGKLADIAQLYDDYYKGRRAYKTVAAEISTHERSARSGLFQPLMSLPTIHEIFTTNYDCLVESTFPPTDCQVVFRATDLRQSRPHKLRIVKLHGTRSDIDSMVLTKGDYQTYFEKHAAIVELTRTLLRQKTFVIVGYSLEDDNFGTIYKQADMGEEVLNFFVSPDTSLFQELHWKSKLEHIPSTAEQFFHSLSQAYGLRHYTEDTAYFPDPGVTPEPVEPLNNPFVLYDTEALIEEKPQFLFETFVRPVEFPLILEHQHTIIEGHRGSGKSTILWRLSLKSRVFEKDSDLPMWGFYVKMVPGLFTAFRRPRNADGTWAASDQAWLHSFTHYFNLILLDGILLNLEEATKQEVLKASSTLGDVTRDIAARLLRFANPELMTNLTVLRRYVEDGIDTVLNSRGELGFYTGPTFITRVLDCLSDGIEGLRDKWWHILLDEYDNVYPEQQAVVNVLLRERHSKLRFKIAVKTLHAYLVDIGGRSLEPTDDFGYVSCDSFIWDKKLKQQYIEFLENISNRRLKQAGYTEYNIRELLPDDVSSATRYAGFETYCLLSSGLTRQFLELCKDAVYEAFPASAFSRVDLQPIPIRTQHHVAKVHSAILFKSYRSTPQPQRVFRLFRVLGPLFRGIAKVTANQKEYRNPLSFEIVDLDQVSKESAEVLEDAIKCRLLQFPMVPKQPHNPMKEGPAQKYSFHRLLAPIFGLSLNERYDVPLSAASLNRIWFYPNEVLEELAEHYKTKGIVDYLDDLYPLLKEARHVE